MPLNFLQTWYQAQCNGFWEHAYGVTIQTLDNPGWLVKIDVVQTPLEDHTMLPLLRENSPDDWISCNVMDNCFQGQGDSTKLTEILECFAAWALTQPIVPPIIPPRL